MKRSADRARGCRRRGSTALVVAAVALCPLVCDSSVEAIRRSLARCHSEDPDLLSFFCWVGRTQAFGPGGEDPWVTLRAELLEGLSTELATVQAELRAVEPEKRSIWEQLRRAHRRENENGVAR